MGCSASLLKDPGAQEVPAPQANPPSSSVPPAGGAGTKAPRKVSQKPPEAPTLPDSGQVLHDVAGAAQAMHASAEEHIGAAAQMREDWLSNIEAQGEDLTSTDVDVVLDVTEELVHLFRSACSKGQQREATVPDVQILQLPRRSPVEQFFAKYSALGQVLVDMAGPAMEAMPFGAPAAAVIGAVYARASQAARLSRNCELLLDLLKRVDAQLARVLDCLASGRKKAPSGVESALQELLLQIVQGGRLMQEYTQRGFVMRFILSKGDECRFAELDKAIHQSMEWTAFCVSMDLLASPASYQPDESASLRVAVCAAAGMPEDRAEEALCQLSKSHPGRLQELIQQHGSLNAQVLSAELGSILERVEVLEEQQQLQQQQLQMVQGEVKMHGRILACLERNARAASRQEQDTHLEAYLNDWWEQTMGKRKRSVSVDDFFKKLLAWFKGKGLLSVLLEYEEEVEEHCTKEMLEAASMKVYLEEGGRVLVFLTFVVLPLVDANNDGKVAYQELVGLQVQGEQFAMHLRRPRPPSALDELLDVIFRGFDEKAVFKRAHYTASTPGIALVSQALKVTPMLQSTIDGVLLLLKSHVPGTRQWLFDRVNEWLEVALSAGRDAGTLSQHRMFLLLGGPGMGKSVFSAVLEKKLDVRMLAGPRLVLVRHFFKVGEPRAQGKVMVLCLAMQLAEQLPGMAAFLRPVAEEHGCADQLSLRDTFDKYMLEPLDALDKKHSVEHPVVLMLLDAIDEAADGATGCEPVANLVGYQMSKLPSWVKIVLTGRPQMESCFKAWEPEWIQPSYQENMEDMSMLLVARLQQGGFVSPVDLAAAVDVMLKKSQGQFIWAKYAFDELSSKEGLWTPAEMEAALPSGLSGVFRHVMGVLEGALQADMPDALTLLREQLLPILVAAKSPLSPQQLAVMAGAEQKQVDLLLRLLVNMFPVRLQSGTLRVFPYHKSVLDWLVEDPQSSVDARRGHECAGKACFAAVMAARPSASLSEDKDEQRRGSKESSSRQCSGGPLLADDEGEQEEKERGGLIMGSSSSSSSHPLRCILEYALRFGVAHLCLADRCGELLEGLILDFCGLWPMAFARGWGSELLKDLIALGLKASTVVKDVVRWLRLTSSYLSMHPRAALQLACDSPHNSVVARHANSLPAQPQAKLLTKEQDWHVCLSVLTGHRNGVLSMAVCADTIVSGSLDNTVRVWDLESGTCKATLAGHSASVTSVALSPDAHVCVSGSDDRTLRVWDLESGTCKATLAGHSCWMTTVSISPDARVCVSGSGDFTLRVWDLQSGTCKATLAGHSDSVTSVALSPDARVCVSGSDDKTLRVWDLESGACKATLDGHSASVRTVSISLDARVCVSCSDNRTLRVWDLEIGACKATLDGHSDSVRTVSISPDARVCVSGSHDYTLRVWDLESGTCKATLDGHSNYVMCTAISLDARLCVSGSVDKTLRVWDLESGACKATLDGHSHIVNNIALSLDARLCVSGSRDRTLRVWDLQSGTCKALLDRHSSWVTSIAHSLDGRLCVSSSADKTLRVWDLQSGACKATLAGHNNPVTSVALSPDACVCVSGSVDKTLRVWDLESGACKAMLAGHSASVRTVSISPDAHVCVSGSDDAMLRKWDITTGEELACFNEYSKGGQ